MEQGDISHKRKLAEVSTTEKALVKAQRQCTPLHVGMPSSGLITPPGEWEKPKIGNAKVSLFSEEVPQDKHQEKDGQQKPKVQKTGEGGSIPLQVMNAMAKAL